MARVTVEDCLEHVENRFDLVLKASERAHKLELGAADPIVDRDNDKPTVIALREIAAGLLSQQAQAELEKTEESQVDIADSYFSSIDDVESDVPELGYNSDIEAESNDIENVISPDHVVVDDKIIAAAVDEAATDLGISNLLDDQSVEQIVEPENDAADSSTLQENPKIDES